MLPMTKKLHSRISWKNSLRRPEQLPRQGSRACRLTEARCQSARDHDGLGLLVSACSHARCTVWIARFAPLPAHMRRLVSIRMEVCMTAVASSRIPEMTNGEGVPTGEGSWTNRGRDGGGSRGRNRPYAFLTDVAALCCRLEYDSPFAACLSCCACDESLQYDASNTISVCFNY